MTMTQSTASQASSDFICAELPAANSTRRVLIIDDDPADRELYQHFLKADNSNSYDIKQTGLGKHAIEMSKTSEFDCVLLDYYLTDLDGLEILDSLNTIFSRKVPVIMLTGQGNETIAVEALRAGAADYLPKRHVSAESLKRSVNNAIEKSYLRNAITQQTERLRTKNRELTRKHDEIQRFYQTVSHELKTPLTSMKEFVSIILDGIAGPISDEQREYLELVYGGCQQMTNDVNDLLDITRLETGKYRVELVPTDLTQLLKHVVQNMNVISKEKSISLKLNIRDSIPEIPLDEQRIEQVMSNLIGNAIKFTSTGGKINVTIELKNQEEERVCISVQDNGIGLPKDKLHNVFERLFQVNPESGFDTEVTSKAGLGLGLTISKELVNLHGGHISVESELGRGSTFTVSLPVYWNNTK